MADPVLPDFYRVQMIIRSQTGLPEDVRVNSLCFRNDAIGSTAAGVADRAKLLMEEFWVGIHAPGAAALRTFLPGQLTAGYDIKVYDLGQPPGSRFPIERALTVASGTPSPAPEEVAACISWVCGQNRPRRRGRMFIGPLGTSCWAIVSGRIRLAPAFSNALVGAGNFLQKNTAHGLNLHVLSQADQNAYEVSGGWVDDAFDTIRSRGPAATARTNFGAYAGMTGPPAVVT